MSFGARVFLVPLFVGVCIHLFNSSAIAGERCREPAGRLVSVQGQVQVQSSGEGPWAAVRIDDTLCPGDSLRVGNGGRAAVALANQSILRIDQNSTLSLGSATTKKSSLLKLLHGVLHIFSHRPNALDIETPYVSGAVEGTEFVVRVEPQKTVIIVFEGRIRAVNDQGQLEVASGQAIVAERGGAPQYITVVRPRDAVQWTLYYPVIIDRPGGTERPKGRDPLQQAVDNLSIGRVDEARAQIAAILARDPDSSDAYALQAIIEVVQNNPDPAILLASKAIALNPRSAAAALAMSYARQAVFDIPGALAILDQARQSNPDSVEILARLAELQLSVGELDMAESSAGQAVALNPEIGRTQTVLGFAFLTRIETGKAKAAFRKAIVLDSAQPLARLGLGLALIREGELEAGREEIEIAAALDPGNALIRSYLGKAYYEEKRDSQARRQYEIAKDLDPADPTPWFYDALRKQSLNRPVAALHDLQRSIELNGNRAVYRSRLLLDEDLAVRSVSLSSIYNDLGFEKMALVDGVKSVNIDPSNYSAHRFLSDIYSSQSRHEIARVSELLQSQLLQPLNGNPVHPQAAQNDLNIFRDAGLSGPTYNEYTPLFNRNQGTLSVSGLTGGRDTQGEEIVVSGLWNWMSGSIGGMHYETDGFRENNDQQQDIFHLFSQVSLSPQTDLMVEYRNFDREFGDLPLRFFSDLYFPDDRNDENTESIRLGFHHAISPQSDLIGTIVAADYDYVFNNDPLDFDYDYVDDRSMEELQHIIRSNRFNLLYGFSHFRADATSLITFGVPGASTILENNEIKEDTKTYAYLNVDLPDAVIWTVGASVESFNGIKDKDLINPKLGVTWSPLTATTIRAAATHVLRSHFINDQTLEPTQVAGFNQFYDDIEGAEAWRYGLAVDQKLNDTVFGGIEVSKRELDVPYEVYFVAGQTDWEEQQVRLYLSWAPATWFSTTVEYIEERFERNPECTGAELVHDLKIHKFPINANIFLPSGLTATLNATFVDQTGEFDLNPLSYQTERGEDNFWVVDATLRYRLPKRHGILSLEIKNLFDESFQFQTMDPSSPEYVPERWILGKLTVTF